MSTAVDGPLPARITGNTTLRRQLLMSLLAPIMLVLVISSSVSYYFSVKFATLAYDYALFDSALDISRQVRVRNGELHLDLPRAALDMLESDTHDHIYFMVSDTKGTVIAGHAGLPPPPKSAATGNRIYYDGNYRGNPVRIAGTPCIHTRRYGAGTDIGTGRGNPQQTRHSCP